MSPADTRQASMCTRRQAFLINLPVLHAASLPVSHHLLPAIILAASLMALQTIILVAGRMTLRVTNRRKSLHVPVTPAMVSSMKIRTTGQIAVLRQNHLISLLRWICSQDFCHRNSSHSAVNLNRSYDFLLTMKGVLI